MQRALAMRRQVENCLAQGSNVTPPVNGGVWNPNEGGTWIGSTYPDRSGWCG